MRIAIIGSGIAGLVSAYVLRREHEITVFEAGSHVGGHANTISVDEDGRDIGVDTGFVVFNEAAYPNFVKLLSQVGVASQPSDMSFSVQCASTGLEYASSSLSALFAQRRNVLNPSFLSMVRDIRRFFRESREVLANGHHDVTLGDYLADRNYSRSFIENHIVPMGSAIWSSGGAKLEEFPARQFVQFFDNHGFLQVRDRPQWRTITGGSRRYVEAVTASFRDRIHLNTPIQSVTRGTEQVTVRTLAGESHAFDHVVIATHSDQALRMLTDATEPEREILGAIPYEANDTVLHTDTRLMPSRRRAWASWNYYKPRDPQDTVSITYCMNNLQSISSQKTYCVSLNRATSIDDASVIQHIDYEHPIFSNAGFDAQRRHGEISGVNRTHYCGAYWGYGFHEDGVRSALNACKYFGVAL